MMLRACLLLVFALECAAALRVGSPSFAPRAMAGCGRAAVRLQGPKPKPKAPRQRAVRYIPEEEMQAHVLAAATDAGFEEGQAMMLAACGRNIYAIGSGYHPNVVTILEEICRSAAAKEDGGWAILLQRCLDGSMPRLRSEQTANARMAAARSAAAAKRRSTAQRKAA